MDFYSSLAEHRLGVSGLKISGAVAILTVLLSSLGIEHAVARTTRLVPPSLSVTEHLHVAESFVTQTVRGTVIDRHSQLPLPGASVVVLGTDPLLGTITDSDGRFEIPRVPLGRHDIEVRFLGFQTVRKTGVLVGSAKQVVLTFELEEQVITGEDIVVTPDVQKDRPINELAVVSVRPFSVEETRRYAGGIDDPARMASAFAGVATTGDIADNALIIRGNSPKGVLWRLEGVEIPNPNHFAGLQVAGGGGVTVFSSQLLADSDFLTGAFPAEYGDALAGVFDMRLRRGNTEQREHTFQLGLLGIDVATEGPFSKDGNSSYVMNYRYSTLGLLLPLLPVDGLTTYQDLSFKTSFPVGKRGRVDFWGIGGLDGQRQDEVEDPAERRFAFDRTRLRLSLGMGATGFTYRQVLGSRSYLSASLAATAQRTDVQEWEVPGIDDPAPSSDLQSTSSRVISSVVVNHKFDNGALTRSGVSVQGLLYDLDIAYAPVLGAPLQQVASGNGETTLTRAFSQIRLGLNRSVTLDVGLHAQYFALTEDLSIEPRASVRLETPRGAAFTMGYGLHSQIEDLRIYFAEAGDPSAQDPGDRMPNRNLGMTKAHHGVVGFDYSISEVSRLRLEAYYQHLFDVPVIADSSYSLINFEQDFEFRDALTNTGLGRNYGVELTLERFLKDGYYFLVTGSLYESTFRGGDDIWRGTRFDQRFGASALGGREFEIARSGNVVGINGRLSLSGGPRSSPVDQAASISASEVVFDESRPFEMREPSLAVLDLTVTYRRNKSRHASIWALQVKNLLAAGAPYDEYDFVEARVVEQRDRVVLPVLSYKIEF